MTVSRRPSTICHLPTMDKLDFENARVHSTAPRSRLCSAAYAIAAAIVLALPLARIVVLKLHGIFLLDLAAYCDVSRALFLGANPFPANIDALTLPFGEHVPIVYPGQMLFFALPGCLWGNFVQISYIVLNVAIVWFVAALTLVRACGYAWRDIFRPGLRQLIFAICASLIMSTWCVMQTMRIGQIPVMLAFCLYGMFWLPSLRRLRPVLFAFIAVAKYSVLTVFAPLLFFKGHRKLCFVAFAIFVVLSVSPVLCGNDLVEVYRGYSEAVVALFQPGGVNHYGQTGITSCHLGFFKADVANHVLKAFALCPIVWLFWKERKTRGISDAAMLLAFSLTMLVSYHSLHDYTLVLPLFVIRIFAFAKERNWRYLAITAAFPAYFIIPGRLIAKGASFIGRIPHIGSLVQLSNPLWEKECHDLFPLTAFVAIALALWSFHLYRHVRNPYVFDLHA